MKNFYFWSILILFILALLPAALWAQNDTQRSASDSQREPNTHVTATHAMDVGYAFMRTGNGSRSGGTQSGNVRKQAMQLVYTGRATDTLTHATTDCYYVFALQPKGFVIVAADNRVEPILGYSYDNNFVVENMPGHIKGWLNDYEKQIEVVTKSARLAEADIQTKWTRLESGQPLSNTRNGNTVGPLLTTTWDQETYYNALCPEDPNGPGGHVVTGCVATAMAQLINYWGYPKHGRGTIHGDGFTNYYDGISSYYYEYSINLDTVTYDYVNMPVSLSSNSSLSEINAVAKLMFHCGASVLMDYGPYASGTSDLHIRSALVSQFRYSPHTGLADRNQYTETEWNNLLRSEIAVGQPVLYCGADGSTGHCFVCDGYDNNDYFHFNFGWSGNGDGWYLTSAVNPGSYAFNSSQSVIIGVVPDSLSNVLYSSAGYMEYTIDSTIVFGDQLDNNPFRCWKNPATTNWYTLGYNVVTFRPADTTKQLILEILSFNNHYIDVYDGTAYDSTLRWFNENGNNSGLQPILSTRHALNLEVGYRQRSEQGFRFRISCEDMYPCRWVTNIVPTADTTAIHLHWNEVGDASQWQIEYGLKGFSHGEGTMVIAQDTTTSLTGLLPLKEYDIYIRPMCDTNLFGVWSPVITVRTLALGYWKDQVLNQPEGYVEDSLGNAYISSAEGLTWFYKLAKTASYSNSNYFFSGKKAVLTADIDLSGYIWLGIGRFYGTFDGQGHTVTNMYSTEGLFDNAINAEVKNINLINFYAKRGGLIRRVDYSMTIMNCFVSGEVDADNDSDAGAIVSDARSGTHVNIINCASNCKVSGKTTGGIVGCGRSGSRSERSVIVRNCYSASTIKSTSSWQGSILGYAEDAETENCYAYKERNGNLRFNGGGVGSVDRDISLFNETDSGFYLLQPIYFETDSLYYSNLTEALNAGVRKYNMEGLRLWVDDTAGVNEGMPLLGPEYVVTCPNIQNFAAKNIVGANGEYGLELSWDEMGNASTWEIEYYEANSPNRMRIMTSSNPDTLWGLTEQTTYVFRVRPICGTSNIGGWSEVYSHVFDRPYWTEIVTSQPDGYDIDSEGNVVISTAEGLAWLISTVNGLNGQTSNDFHGKKIVLTQNINIGQFRWTAINNLLGTFDGKGNTIRGLYINELSSEQGLFGFVSCGTFINVKLDSANVKGNAAVGILVGQASYFTFINCHVSGTVYGKDYVGGMAGSITNNSLVNACSSDGIVQAENDGAGGLIGNMSGIVRNSCSRCAVIGGRYTSGGLIGTVGSVVENCYATGNVSGYFYNGGLTGSFAGEMRNCYAGGTVPGRADVCMGMGGGDNIVCGYRKGALIGTRGTANVSNCYGLADFSQHPLVGISEYGDPIVIYDTASFTVLNDSILLLNSVAVSQNYYDNILDALNAWVDTYDTTGLFLHWVEDTAGINGGFPMFEEMKYNTLTLTVADSTPYGTVNGSGTYNHISSAVITATADRGYRFVQWNDGNTDNPRTVKITQDTIFVAVFEKGMFSIVGTPGNGLNYSFDFEDPTRDLMWTLQNGDYGNQWYITTLDDTNRALFISCDNGISSYYIEKESENSAYTTLLLTKGQYNYSYDYLCRSIYAGVQVLFCPASEQLPSYTWPLSNGIIPLGSHNGNSMEWINHSGQVNIPSTGEYFVWVHWQSVRTGRAKRDAPAIDNIQFNQIITEDNFHGYVIGSDTVPYLDSVVLTAVPFEDYQFSQWHDGNTENPRTVIATSDKFFIALFEEAPSIIVVDSIVACDSYQWHGNVYTASTMLFDTLPATGGGDSVVAHYLMVNHPAHTAITETACESFVWTHVDGTTQTCMVSGDYTYSHIDANGCTQVDTLHLTVYHTVNSASFVTTCDSYTWTHADGTTQVCNISDDYIYSYENAYGCPQVDTLHLTVNHATSGEITISACDSFDWHDSTYTESGDYVRTLSNAVGCDSVVTLHLTVNHPAHTAITETACESYTWMRTDGTTQTYFISGDYLYSHPDVNGCTQVDTLHLAIHHPSTSVDEQTACGPFTWINGETYTSSVFGPTYTLSNEAGCDSVVTLSLTMYHSDTTQFAITACNSFVWGDSTYTETGDYAQTYEGSNGCLSVTIMHLTINYSDTTEESATACDSYLWHGNNYTESGDYTVYYTNTDGCNSMANLHLTVNHSTVGEIVATACENYEWHGIVYTESGEYDYTVTAANGCDSVITLHLTVNENVATEFTITTADSCYIWNGQSYCASGDYTQSFETVNGCDSVVTLHLTITVGIDDYDFANVMKLYPNPTSDLVNVQLTINNEQLGEVGIQVFDVYGRLLEVVNMADARGAALQTTQIDLSRYAKGVYFVKAASEGKVVAVRKVVKR